MAVTVKKTCYVMFVLKKYIFLKWVQQKYFDLLDTIYAVLITKKYNFLKV